ncbi:purine nucleoside permease [Stereum hirsutum FP-91666 SS1]|uniref:purine nucleoside permease n=1 Tax=Stereum hirsutum (strain FP-91666) TaxID=721885 RepID=UPI000440A860|nr:purine nucleoside permease [Stereum hirsutum FP-91666 SS1]EIM89098.1 purine nucleoside permease [Stereum hirsutum FP-91666 SS1]
MFAPEGEVWQSIPEFNILAQNITVPGFSPLFPSAHCTSEGTICQLVTGEAEINAASTISALAHSPLFDLTKTYFLIAGIAGVNPKVATVGSVTFARYAIQVALQYEIDAREKPDNFSTGYIPQGSFAPDQYPLSIYGTEVFEVNDALRQVALGFTSNVTLNDSTTAQETRALYATTPSFAPGANPAGPSIIACDTSTSDVYFSGDLLGETFENTTKLFTNGTGVYCTTQQEDNATLEALLRASIGGLVDFSRIIIMRSGSNFDRPYAGQSAVDHLFGPSAAFEPSLVNLYIAGVKVVEGIIEGWAERFEEGVKAMNYVGDIFGSLGGQPDFGPGSVFGGQAASRKRGLKRVAWK